MSKCKFGAVEVDYLGHLILGAGDLAKIASLLDWPVPTFLKSLRGFLGLTGYYRKFINRVWINCSSIDNPFEEKLIWVVPSSRNNLCGVETSCYTTTNVKITRFLQAFYNGVDASGNGLGVVLMQDGQPIAYFSKALKGRSLSPSTYEKELLALVASVEVATLFVGVVIQDENWSQQALKLLLEQKVGTESQQKWITKHLGYDFTIDYKKGKENKVADGLSRRGEEQVATLALISFPTHPFVDKRTEEQLFIVSNSYGHLH